MTLSIAVICEAAADRETACGLADRVICEEVKEWISEDVLDAFRCWRGFLASDSFLSWIKDVPRLAKERNIRLPHGFREGAGQAPDELAARRALRLLYDSPDRPDAILLIRDDDGKEERRMGLERARDEARAAMLNLGPIVIGLAHLKRECWVLVGFVPQDEAERQTAEELRQELSFHPSMEPERLRGKHNEPRDAKRVLALLTRGDREREAQCWQATSLADLEQRGQTTGLAAYLDELRRLLIPLFRGGR